MADDPKSNMRLLQRQADRICAHILNSDYPLIDVEIERNSLREECFHLFPGRLWLYDLIYEARFDRLIHQFREEDTDGRWNNGSCEFDGKR